MQLISDSEPQSLSSIAGCDVTLADMLHNLPTHIFTPFLVQVNILLDSYGSVRLQTDSTIISLNSSLSITALVICIRHFFLPHLPTVSGRASVHYGIVASLHLPTSLAQILFYFFIFLFLHSGSIFPEDLPEFHTVTHMPVHARLHGLPRCRLTQTRSRG